MIAVMTAWTEQRLAQSEALVQDVLVGEAIANGGYVVLVADDDMRYLAASDAACELLGYSREELLGLAVPDIVVETDASRLYDEFMRDREQHGAITLRRKDGKVIAARYDARQTEIGGLPYYVSVISPVASS
jgi:PAS domain S-box-containing protein